MAGAATAAGCGPGNAASDRGGQDAARGARRHCRAGEQREATVGAARRGESEARYRDAWHAVPTAA
jgi:hypothetical protein